MTYADLKGVSGRKPVSFIELVVPKCSRTYGSAPCTAAVGVTGTTKCFNTRHTCQDVANYDQTTQTMRFSSDRIDNLQGVGELPTFPALKGVSIAPTRLDPGRSLGVRASVTVKLNDFPWSDVGTDPYLADRSYDPEEQGTFFGKFIARLQYFENLQLFVHTGFLDADDEYQIANFIKREFRAYKMSGPSVAGDVVIVAKDPLRAADSFRSQIPTPSDGYLDADINDSTTTLQLATGQAAAYSTSNPWIRVDDEVMRIDSINLGLDQLTVTRARLPSFYPSNVMVADAHDQYATVQQCELFRDDRIDDVVYDLLTIWAGIDSSYIDFTAWQDISDGWFQNYYLSTLITAPTGVDELLNELCQHNMLLWWDEREQEFKFDALKPFSDFGVAYMNDAENIIGGSVSTSRDPRQRVSQTWVYYGRRNPVETSSELRHFQGVQLVADLDAESAEEYGERQVYSVYSRWLDGGQQDIALEIGGRYLAEYRDTKTVLRLQADPKDDAVWTGAQIYVGSRYYQDAEGASSYKAFHILEASEKFDKAGRFILQYTMQNTRTSGICAIVGPDTLPDYTAASEAQRRYGFISATATERMSNGDPPYIIC